MSVFINASGTKQQISHIFANIDGNKKKIISAWANKGGIITKVFNENKFEINSDLYLVTGKSDSMYMSNSNYTTTWIPIVYSSDFINFRLVQCNDDKTSALYISKASYEEKRISEIIYNPVLKTYFAHGITRGTNTSGFTTYGGRYFILSSKDGIRWDTVFVKSYSYYGAGNIKLICNESNGDMIYVAANLTSSSSIFILHSSNGIEWESISPTLTCNVTVNSFFSHKNFNPINLTYLNDGYFYYSMEITSYKEDYSVLANYAFIRSLDGITWEPVYGYTDSEFSIYFPNMTKVSSLYNAKKIQD